MLSDLDKHFPDFAGCPLSWAKVPDGQDPPDFLAHALHGLIGLELIEWLDGGQMTSAKGRESHRDALRRILGENWQSEYQPQNLADIFIAPVLGVKITNSDEKPLRNEFYRLARYVDQSWRTNPERMGRIYDQTDFSGYALLARYFQAIRYIGGSPHGCCWINSEEDGGAYDPGTVIQTLKRALDRKLSSYSMPEKQLHLKTHGLTELYLLVHGGSNAYRFNTPHHPLSLESIARSGAHYYAAHPQRDIFSRVWFFESLDSADEVNQLLGYPPGNGNVRWLAQLWPVLKVLPGSVAPR